METLQLNRNLTERYICQNSLMQHVEEEEKESSNTDRDKNVSMTIVTESDLDDVTNDL